LDTVYSIEKKEPYIRGSITSFDSDATEFWGEYYLNDQTFANLAYINANEADESLTYLKGSYLFDFGLFVGLDYITVDDENVFLLSPGYRYNFNDNGYIAFSIDYLDYDGYSEVSGYDFDWSYYSDKMKFVGQLYKFKELDDLIIDINYAYQISDQITAGVTATSVFDIVMDLGYTFNAGITWNVSNFILDLTYGNLFTEIDQTQYYLVGVMYNINDTFGAGIDFQTFDDYIDDIVSYKFKYVTDTTTFGLRYTPENDSLSKILYLTCEYKF
jgi:hypothetical protein